jgi:hypothetical protein
MSNDKQDSNKQDSKKFTKEDIDKAVTEALIAYRSSKPFFEMRSGISHHGRYEIDVKIYMGDAERAHQISLAIRELLKDI